jgi:trans-aconitate 2-methyltransferase
VTTGSGTAFGWDPARYQAFSDDRSRPFHDLVARIAADAPRRVVDLGCGPGNLTATLAARWPDADVVGTDSSAAMLADAAHETEVHPNLSFVQQPIEDWTPTDSDDVVVTNAALQWVPSHVELLPGWLAALPDGAWFAMQVPGNWDARSHALMRETAAEGPWASALDGVLRTEPVLDGTGYLDLFESAGLGTVAWETTYLQLLQGEDPVLAWVRGTGLRPALAALDAADPSGALTTAYETTYRDALRRAYPAGPHGTVFPFRRIFAVGQKR